MITQVTGNLLDSDAEALVNTVNIVGVMGKGIALQFKKAFPDNFKEYEEACEQGNVRLGEVFITKPRSLTGPKFIINFPTKKHWKGKSRIEDIETGLRALAKEVKERCIRSLAIPPLGCGLGGLNWTEVRARIEEAFAPLPEVDVRLYAPRGAPDASAMPNRTEKPKMTQGKASFLGLLEQYTSMLFDPEFTLLEIQKLSYFLQLAGEPLRLRFVKWYYGPYADGLRHVLNQLEGHYLMGWGDGANRPLARFRLLSENSQDVAATLQNNDFVADRIRRVLDLVEGFDSPYGMELLGTVHWVLAEELSETATVDDVHKAISAWTERKSRMFQPPHIEVAMHRLLEQGWVRRVNTL